MALDFDAIMGVGGIAARLKRVLIAIFDPTTGHNHDGSNSALASGVDGTPADDSVTVAKLADNAVETAKIKNANITEPKLHADVVAKLLGTANVTEAMLHANLVAKILGTANVVESNLHADLVAKLLGTANVVESNLHADVVAKLLGTANVTEAMIHADVVAKLHAPAVNVTCAVDASAEDVRTALRALLAALKTTTVVTPDA
jgi:hypothetical protein